MRCMPQSPTPNDACGRSPHRFRSCRPQVRYRWDLRCFYRVLPKCRPSSAEKVRSLLSACSPLSLWQAFLCLVTSGRRKKKLLELAHCKNAVSADQLSSVPSTSLCPKPSTVTNVFCFCGSFSKSTLPRSIGISLSSAPLMSSTSFAKAALVTLSSSVLSRSEMG